MSAYPFLPSLVALLPVLLVSLQQLSPVSASPFGALSCQVGRASVGGSHLEAAEIQTGAVSLENGFLLTINGELPIVGNPYSFAHNAAHELSLLFSTEEGQPPQAIRGFNFVISYNASQPTAEITEGVNLLENVFDYDSFFTSQPDADQQSNDFCALSSDDNNNNNYNYHVAGLTHTNANDKSAVTTSLFFDFLEEDTTSLPLPVVLPLDVTVVMQNRDGLSIYYYSQFLLRVIPGELLDEGLDTENEGPTNETVVPTSEPGGGGLPVVDEALRAYADDFSMLLEALEVANLTQTLRNLETMTLLAPTNNAVAQVDRTLWNKFVTNPDYQHHLVDLLQYHVIPNQIVSGDDTPLNLATLNQNGETVSYQDGVLNDGMATIVEPRLVPVANGVISAISAVLGRTQLVGSILSILQVFDQANNNYSILLSLLEAAGKTEYLSNWDNTATLFVAENAAWEAVYSADDLAALTLPENVDEINLLLDRHMIINQNVVQDDWIRAGSITMTSGEVFPVTVSSSATVESPTPAISSTIAGVVVATPNLFVTNGIMHSIEAIFLPGDDDPVLPGSNNETQSPSSDNDLSADPSLNATGCVLCNGGSNATDACCQPGDTGNATSATTSGTQSCQLCDGGTFQANFVFPDQTKCGILVDETGESRVDSEEECTYNRALAAGYCGCPFPAGVCNVCYGNFSRN